MNVPACWLALIVCLAASLAALAEEQSIHSPAELWQGYDPEALPLEIESLERWTEDGIQLEKLRFTSEVFEGGKARVLAIVGKKSGDNQQPGVLHIHGGGQTLSLDWVKFWTKRGYVCATYDFCGQWEGRKEFTDWGPLKHGNMAHAAGGFQVTPTPRESSWYHWTIAARRTLTLLTLQPEVDRERLGIFGISMGGTLCWSVAASDARVKTAVPIYGCGYNVDGQRTQWGFPKLTPELALFQRAVSPEAHAPYITCPILFLNATNDFHGWMDRSYDILAATPSPRWQAYSPRFNHHIAAAQGANLPLWMDISGSGNIWFYEWYPQPYGNLVTTYAGYVYQPGWYKRWIIADVPGWHILQYYCNGWSNYAYSYVYGSGSGGYYPTPSPGPQPYPYPYPYGQSQGMTTYPSTGHTYYSFKSSTTMG